MANVAHDLSPASPGGDGIALQRDSRPEPLDRGKLRVFISYSRDDLHFADQLNAALDACGFQAMMDRHGISGGEDWKLRLGNMISEADTVVFILSPDSARSEICSYEVEQAVRLGKRILPVNCRPLEGASAPARLQDLNYIFFHAEPKAPGSGFGTGLASLIAALNTDFDWLREHTRYLQRAMEWKAGGRPANRLLSGNDIHEAKAWVTRRPKSAPEPTALHLDFIRASEEEMEARSSEQRKQLAAIAAAQSEREIALYKTEQALKQAADAQRKRARIRNIAFVAVSLLAVVAGLLGWRAKQQRVIAEKEREQADAVLARATNIIVNLQTKMDIDTKTQVFDVFREGAEHGDVRSMHNLGVAYQKGDGVAQDYAEAREWYEKAAVKGDANSMTRLGWIYSNGLGVARDDAEARGWYEKAAAKGNATAMFLLGALYNEGHGVAQDYAKAHQWYEKAAEKNEASAMASLGWLYANGLGVVQDYAKAREWFEKAEEHGETSAMASLGWLYENGFGVSQDYAEAHDRYEKAAAKGDHNAMFLLGVLYSNGHGVTQDYAKAREWYEKSADKGDATAMFLLGVLYSNGNGVTQDYTKAREWFEKAALKGEARAMANLGVLYSNGDGVAQDYAKAREWYEKAAANGEPRAKALLDQLP